MSLSTYNISAEQGTTYVASIVYSDDNGDPVNLSGYTSRMQVRRFSGSPRPNLTLTNTGGMTLQGVNGTILISISADALASVPAGNYVYDLEIVNGATVTKILSGDFTVSAEITR